MSKKQLALVLIAAASTVLAVDWAKHPHLRNANEAIERAKNQLKVANDHKKTEFGGHRDKAIQLLNQAQQEVEQSVTYADSAAQ